MHDAVIHAFIESGLHYTHLHYTHLLYRIAANIMCMHVTPSRAAPDVFRLS